MNEKNSPPAATKQLPDTAPMEVLNHRNGEGSHKPSSGHYEEDDRDRVSPPPTSTKSRSEGADEEPPTSSGNIAHHKPHPTLRADGGDFQPHDAEWQSRIEQGTQNGRQRDVNIEDEKKDEKESRDAGALESRIEPGTQNEHVLDPMNIDDEKEVEKKYRDAANADPGAFPTLHTRRGSRSELAAEKVMVQSSRAEKELAKNGQIGAGVGKGNDIETGAKHKLEKGEVAHDQDQSFRFAQRAIEHYDEEQPQAGIRPQDRNMAGVPDGATPENEDVILEATLVNEQSQAIQVAKYEKKTLFGSLIRNKWFWLGTFLLVALIVGLAVGLTVSGGSDGPYGNTTALLIENSLDGGEQLTDTTTPQYRAMVWLEKNANINRYSDEQKLQRYVLATFYYSTNGPAWTHQRGWVTDDEECTWFNADEDDYLCGDGFNVSSIAFAKNNLVGFLPVELALLSNSLASLNLEENKLSGPMPTEIGLLTALTSIKMEKNELSGPMPTEIGLMAALTFLNLKSNKLSQSIPSEVGQLKNLQNLDLDKNKFEGFIPSEIGLIDGRKISLNFNQLQGSLPTEIGLLSNLLDIEAGHNTLVGSIPTEILAMSTLEKFLLLANNIEGTIATEFGALPNLDNFSCRSNNLRGSLPSEFGMLSKLEILNIHSNELTGTIPTELYQLTEFRRGSFYDNMFEPPFDCSLINSTHKKEGECLVSCGDKKNESCAVFL